MEFLLDSLLEYSRAGRLAIHAEKTDVEIMVKEIVDLRGFNDNFIIKTDNLPVFMTYAASLRQVLRNIIGNAVKHHDKKKGKIIIEARKSGNFYEFKVSDDGPGIPEKFRERVFGMFQTLRAKDEVEGSGMGLALVKKIVETYNGKVWLETAQPHGTMVFFTWPFTTKTGN